jgi:hypothetical protein
MIKLMNRASVGSRTRWRLLADKNASCGQYGIAMVQSRRGHDLILTTWIFDARISQHGSNNV